MSETHPAWDIWVVWRAALVRRPLASADDTRDTIQADTPWELAALMH